MDQKPVDGFLFKNLVEAYGAVRPWYIQQGISRGMPLGMPLGMPPGTPLGVPLGTPDSLVCTAHRAERALYEKPTVDNRKRTQNYDDDLARGKIKKARHATYSSGYDKGTNAIIPVERIIFNGVVEAYRACKIEKAAEEKRREERRKAEAVQRAAQGQKVDVGDSELKGVEIKKVTKFGTPWIQMPEPPKDNSDVLLKTIQYWYKKEREAMAEEYTPLLEENLKTLKVEGVTDELVPGQLMFRMTYGENGEKGFFISAAEARCKYPQAVIEFYQENLKWPVDSKNVDMSY